MSIHIHAAEDFPHDCNLDEAILLRRELTYYIIRRRGRTRVVVHFEGYAPVVPFAEVQTFFAHVFGDLVRLQRLHPFRIAERLRITSTKSETGTIFKKEAQAALQKAVANLDKKASRAASHAWHRYNPRLNKEVRHYAVYLPNAPRQSHRGQEPHPEHIHLPNEPPRMQMNQYHHDPKHHHLVARPPTPHPEILYPETKPPLPPPAESLPMNVPVKKDAPHVPAKRMPQGYYRIRKPGR